MMILYRLFESLFFFAVKSLIVPGGKDGLSSGSKDVGKDPVKLRLKDYSY